MKIKSLIGPIVLLLIWWIITDLNIVNRILLPSPTEVARAILRLVQSYEYPLLNEITVSIIRVLVGLIIGISIGVPVGLFLGYFRWLYNLCEIPLEFFRSTPVTSLFTFFMLVFGIGNYGKIAVVVWSVSLILIINTIYGVRNCSISRTRYLKSLGANSFQSLVWHILPESIPSIVGGIRISISQAFIVVIVTEMFLSGDGGVGYLLYSAALVYKTDEVLALVIISGLLGYCINKLTELIGKKLIFWM